MDEGAPGQLDLVSLLPLRNVVNYGPFAPANEGHHLSPLVQEQELVHLLVMPADHAVGSGDDVPDTDAETQRVVGSGDGLVVGAEGHSREGGDVRKGQAEESLAGRDVPHGDRARVTEELELVLFWRPLHADGRTAVVRHRSDEVVRQTVVGPEPDR